MRENNDTVIKPWKYHEKNMWKHREKAVKNPRDKCRKITHVTRQKILWVPPHAGPMVGKLGIYSACVFFSHVSPLFKRTVVTCPLEWLGWIDLHFWIPNFQTHSRKSLVLLFLSLFFLVKSPFFLLLKPWVAAHTRAWAMPPLGCRCSGSARPQALNTSTGGGARSAAKQPVGPCAKKRAPCRCGKSYGKLKQYWMVI